mgnify:CR=1 FL=1
MQEVSYIIAVIGTLVLLASGAAWLNGFRAPGLQSIGGRVHQQRSENTAAIALVAAFGISLLAAILGMVAWMF